MDRRLELRHPSDLEVRITTLGRAETHTGTLLDLSGSGICALLPQANQEGELVKVELADTVLFGQVAYCFEEQGSYRTGVAVEQVLFQAADLSTILQALLDDADQPKAILPAH